MQKQLKIIGVGGCNKLELPLFTGVNECKYVKHPIEKIKQILEIGE